MAKCVAVADILGLCFLATACAVDMTAGQVLQGAERWQVANGCRVGVSPNDLRGAFFRLALDLQAEKGPFDLATVVAQMEHTPWHMWTAAMLRADVLWCNDEGESWEPAPADETAAVRASQWRAFLADPGHWQREALSLFLGEQRITAASIRCALGA